MKGIRIAVVGLAVLAAGAALARARDGGEKTCWRCSCSADGGCQCWLISGPSCP